MESFAVVFEFERAANWTSRWLAGFVWRPQVPRRRPYTYYLELFPSEFQ